MKKMKALCLLILLVSCIGNDKFVIKNVTNDDIAIKWYYYSYITNNSPEFIDVKKGDSIVQIYKADGFITDVSIKDKNIVVKGVETNTGGGIIYTKKPLSEVFGYKIIIDSTATNDDYKRTPKAIKE